MRVEKPGFSPVAGPFPTGPKWLGLLVCKRRKMTMKKDRFPVFFVLVSLLLVFLFSALGWGCDDDDDTGYDDAGDDDVADDDTGDDDTGDDDTGDDDTGDDDTADDDTGDDDTEDPLVPECDPDPMMDRTYDESPGAGPLRLKAQDYDDWHLQWHQPHYGSTVEVSFTDGDRDTVQHYGGTGDSCIWTGTYLVSQAFRYHVTKGTPEGDQAKANAIKSVQALSRHLHVTGRDGFIARYVGPLSEPAYGDMAGSCISEPEYYHCIDDGEFAGDFWKGNTSRDQYTGWFFGMGLAYDLVDDEPMRQIIRDDVAEVLDRLMADGWWIIDVDGIPTTAGPNALGSQQMNWALVGYHITGEERFFNVFAHWAAEEQQASLRLGNISIINRYMQHYGLNLGHQNMFNLLRLSRPYCDVNDFLVALFKQQIHYHCDLSHNAFFTTIHMAQSFLDETSDYWDEQLDQMLGDMTDFRDAPNDSYYLEPPPAQLDPVSVFLTDLQADYPWLADIMGTAHYQALDAYPVPQQCTTDFLWQRNPWNIDPCGSDNPAHVNPGADYLVAYWMASAYGFITKEM